MKVRIVGGGLAGCEAAWQLARRGHEVELWEMKPEKYTPAHSNPDLGELVCSNSLKSNELTSASGLLKQEMRLFGSLIIAAADAVRVPAGSALAVDRDAFAKTITERVKREPRITVLAGEVEWLDPEIPTIVATGPLTSDALAVHIAELLGLERLYFYDAEAPIVTAESLNMDVIFAASRYGKGEDYLNCPMDREEYEAFWQALVEAKTAPVHGFEDRKVFEACMPVETLAKRGPRTLAFGPLRPVGLIDPKTGRRPYAAVQLRKENLEGTLYNIVGFQTRLTFGEQKRVFGMIPGLEGAEFVRYGVMHRNTYLPAPDHLNARFQTVKLPNLFFAGQITGVEGYVESAASGLMAAIHMDRFLKGLAPVDFGPRTMLGALSRHIEAPAANYQPMNANFGILEPLPERIRGKKEKYGVLAKRSLAELEQLIEGMGLCSVD